MPMPTLQLMMGELARVVVMHKAIVLFDSFSASNSFYVTAYGKMKLYESKKGCCKAEYHCNFSPNFEMKMKVDGDAYVKSAGMIRIRSLCFNSTAGAAAEMGAKTTEREIGFEAGASLKDGPFVKAKFNVKTQGGMGEKTVKSEGGKNRTLVALSGLDEFPVWVLSEAVITTVQAQSTFDFSSTSLYNEAHVDFKDWRLGINVTGVFKGG